MDLQGAGEQKHNYTFQQYYHNIKNFVYLWSNTYNV